MLTMLQIYFKHDSMLRSARLDQPGLLQHVIVRGIEKRDIFLDDEDRDKLGTPPIFRKVVGYLLGLFGSFGLFGLIQKGPNSPSGIFHDSDLILESSPVIFLINYP